jgi:hypothetical protein
VVNKYSRQIKVKEHAVIDEFINQIANIMIQQLESPNQHTAPYVNHAIISPETPR